MYTFVLGSAEITDENCIFVSRRFFKEISAVNTEYQGTDGRHCDEKYEKLK